MKFKYVRIDEETHKKIQEEKKRLKRLGVRPGPTADTILHACVDVYLKHIEEQLQENKQESN